MNGDPIDRIFRIEQFLAALRPHYIKWYRDIRGARLDAEQREAEDEDKLREMLMAGKAIAWGHVSVNHASQVLGLKGTDELPEFLNKPYD